jgi:cation-transporting ATPase 13A2
MIQFTAVILLYFKGSVLGNWEYLFQDMFLVFPLTVFMGGTRATPHLSEKRPSGNLLSMVNIANVLSHMLICFCFQLIVFEGSQTQPDFFAYENEPDFAQGPNTYESTSLYYYSNFQYIFMALLFARGEPWKARFWTNLKFTGWAVLGTVVSLALLISNDQRSFFRSEEVPIASKWRGLMFLILLVDCALNVLFELLVYPRVVVWYKRWRKSKYSQAQVYGKIKNVDGPKAKRYHRLRGQFEALWNEA